MKSLKTLVSLSALAVCMGAASMANAAASLRTPFTHCRYHHRDFAFFLWPVTCGITSPALLQVVWRLFLPVSPVAACALPVEKYPTRLGVDRHQSDAGTSSGVGYTIAKSAVPATDCGGTIINATYNNATNTLAITGETLTGHTTGTSIKTALLKPDRQCAGCDHCSVMQSFQRVDYP
jgi:hypothetical protein